MIKGIMAENKSGDWLNVSPSIWCACGGGAGASGGGSDGGGCAAFDMIFV